MQALPEVLFTRVAVALAEVLGSFFDKKKRTGSVERKQMWSSTPQLLDLIPWKYVHSFVFLAPLLL